MGKVEIRKLTNIDDTLLNTLASWMYEWWGKRDNYSFDAVKCFMKRSMERDRLPQTFGMFLDDKIVGMYQIKHYDLWSRQDLYPWLANVYIVKEYRGLGLGRKLLESVKGNALKVSDFNEIFLYTEHTGLYEKFGFEYLFDVDTFKSENRIERLYKLKLR